MEDNTQQVTTFLFMNLSTELQLMVFEHMLIELPGGDYDIPSTCPTKDEYQEVFETLLDLMLTCQAFYQLLLTHLTIYKINNFHFRNPFRFLIFAAHAIRGTELRKNRILGILRFITFRCNPAYCDGTYQRGAEAAFEILSKCANLEIRVRIDGYLDLAVYYRDWEKSNSITNFEHWMHGFFDDLVGPRGIRDFKLVYDYNKVFVGYVRKTRKSYYCLGEKDEAALLKWVAEREASVRAVVCKKNTRAARNIDPSYRLWM